MKRKLLFEGAYWRDADARGGGGVPLGFLGRGVQPGSRNHDPISDRKVSFSTPVFRPGLQNPYPFSDLEMVSKRYITCLHKTENMSSLHQKDFLKSISNSHMTLSFLLIWS